jgi:hypothetical protein
MRARPVAATRAGPPMALASVAKRVDFRRLPIKEALTLETYFTLPDSMPTMPSDFRERDRFRGA